MCRTWAFVSHPYLSLEDITDSGSGFDGSGYGVSIEQDPQSAQGHARIKEAQVDIEHKGMRSHVAIRERSNIMRLYWDLWYL